MKVESFLMFTACAMISSGLNFAQAEDFDISPKLDGSNKIVTNGFVDATEVEVENVRVFAYAFGEIPGQPFFLPDPGFHPLPGSGFAQNSLIGFNLAAPLRYWSGSGSPTFFPVGSGESIQFNFGANSVVTRGSAVPSPAGFSFGLVDAAGEFDDHLETYLLGAGGTVANPGSPAEGIYLVTFAVTSSTSGVMPSEPVYELFSNGAFESELLPAAIYVRDTFAPGSTLVVPEPAMIASLAGLAMLSRRRR